MRADDELGSCHVCSHSKLVNAVLPGTVDERVINDKPGDMSRFLCSENIQLALASARGIGCRREPLRCCQCAWDGSACRCVCVLRPTLPRTLIPRCRARTRLVNIGVDDVIEGRPNLMLGILWQARTCVVSHRIAPVLTHAGCRAPSPAHSWCACSCLRAWTWCTCPSWWCSSSRAKRWLIC
jgi:hypothetical protein